MALKLSGCPYLATVPNKELPKAFLSISSFCTFEHMRANVRVVKQDVTQQLYTVAHVVKTLQLQYLA